MTKELEQKVTNILKSAKSKAEQSVEVFSLAEAAWIAGDVNSYDSLVKLLRKFFPEVDVTESPWVLNPARISNSSLPDIDLDTNTQREVLEYVKQKYKPQFS